MKKKKYGIVIIFVLLLLLSLDIHQEYDTNELIRFHVLANSDSDADQALKLEVKNRIIADMEPLLADSQSIQESRDILLAHLSDIQREAEAELRAHGSTKTVDVQYGRFDFPVKYYGAFSLPAGNYEAVRVVIGEGGGQNWWCVLFPPMCFVDAAQVDTDELEKYTNQAPEKKVVLKWRIAQLLGIDQ